MLKKQCPPWGPAQIEAVKQLKVIAQSTPPLQIPTSGQRILQTDASDDYWSVILLEDINGVRHFCSHASGQFKDSEKNYHVVYKEILAGLTQSSLSISEDELIREYRSIQQGFQFYQQYGKCKI